MVDRDDAMIRAERGRLVGVAAGASPEEAAEALLGQMTLEEKLHHLSGEVTAEEAGGAADDAVDGKGHAIGMNTVTGIGKRLVESIRSGKGALYFYSGRVARLGVPAFSFSDGPRGCVVGPNKTCFPVTMARGAAFDRELERRVGDAMGREVRAAGCNYSGAVCVNLLRHPGWGRAQETYGEDPYHVGELGLALTRGIQRHKVMACVKHFALNSIENSRFHVDVRCRERVLREVYLPHFRKIITSEGGAASVMGAYNLFRGEHCCQNRYLLTTLLRERWGFLGFVTSDWFDGVRDGPKAVVAGCDVEMPVQRYCTPELLGRAVAAGELPLSSVDASVRAILRTKLRFALAPEPPGESYVDEPPGRIFACPAHVALAQEVAEKSMVLVRNDGALLPLDGAKVRRVVVLGRAKCREKLISTTTVPLHEPRNTGDRGSSLVMQEDVVTPAEGLRRWAAAAPGVGREVVSADDSDLERAAELARGADAVVCVAGFTFEVCPSGKLPFTVPTDAARDLPPFDTSADVAEYGMYHGYTLYEKRAGGPGAALAPAPAYPFGHGLSYTRFEYGGLRVLTPQLAAAQGLRDTDGPDGPLGAGAAAPAALVVTASVRNVGGRAGAEIAQCYVGFSRSALDRPRKLLKGFERLENLQPGESREVRFEVPQRELAYFDEAGDQWRVEAPMRYEVYVGGCSDEKALLRGEFEIVQGGDPAARL